MLSSKNSVIAGIPLAVPEKTATADAWRETLVCSPSTGRHHLAYLRRFPHQGGKGTLKAIVWTILLAYGAYAAYKIIPAYVAEYQLSDKMSEQARFAVVNRYSEDQVRDNIFKVAQDLDIPVKRDQIKVLASESIVRISTDYTIPVDLLVYHMDLHFTPSSENKSIM
jgi:hypothetical protein